MSNNTDKNILERLDAIEEALVETIATLRLIGVLQVAQWIEANASNIKKLEKSPLARARQEYDHDVKQALGHLTHDPLLAKLLRDTGNQA